MFYDESSTGVKDYMFIQCLVDLGSSLNEEFPPLGITYLLLLKRPICNSNQKNHIKNALMYLINRGYVDNKKDCFVLNDLGLHAAEWMVSLINYLPMVKKSCDEWPFISLTSGPKPRDSVPKVLFSKSFLDKLGKNEKYLRRIEEYIKEISGCEEVGIDVVEQNTDDLIVILFCNGFPLAVAEWEKLLCWLNSS